jgi:hypothetical protein
VNANNAKMKSGLSHALGVVFELDDAGCTVLGVQIRNREPVIRVDRLPPSARSPIAMTRCLGAKREEVRLVSIRGCQVEVIDKKVVGL